METWGTSGKFDPFEKVYEVSTRCLLCSQDYSTDFPSIQLVFQLTIRSLSCKEIADDPAVVEELKRLYDTLDMGTTPATVLLPWLPTPAMVKKLMATKRIYDIVCKAISDREASGVQHNDTLQMLLDSGDEKLVVVGVSHSPVFHHSQTRLPDVDCAF